MMLAAMVVVWLAGVYTGGCVGFVIGRLDGRLLRWLRRFGVPPQETEQLLVFVNTTREPQP